MMRDDQVMYAGQFLRMHKRGRWEFVCRTAGVSAVGIIAVTDAGELLLVEQDRIPVGGATIELPAGLVGDDAAGEEVIAAAQRELLEETGYIAQKWTYLYDGPSSAGMTDERVHIVRAHQLRQSSPGGGVAGEAITVYRIPLAELDAFLDAKRKQGVLIDFKVRLAGLLERQNTP
jgi:ADP-ribose pyrophosphatase